jgi:hypothetical protein
MDSFKPNQIINDPKLLFGRNDPHQLLDQALSNIKRRTPFQLYGERRSGKTSVLSCLAKILDADPQYIPLLIDLKKDSFIRGNANVFRYLIAKCVYELYKSVRISNIMFSSLHELDIASNSRWEDIYEKLQHLTDFRISGIFEEITKLTRDDFNRIFVLLIDEYEFLFTKSFDSPSGFFVLRELSSLPDAPLVYVVAGATKWDMLCSETGSAELNNLGGSLLYVSPIDYEDFEKMWNYYTNELPDNGVLAECSKVYELSGGIPFFAKLIGECQLSGLHNMIDINLSPHFLRIYNNLNKQEQKIVSMVMNGDNLGCVQVDDLIYRGILKFCDENCDINGELFKKYIYARKYSPSKDDDRQNRLLDSSRKIQSLIAAINDTSINKCGKNIFEVSNADFHCFEDISKLAVEREDINAFASAIYLTVFERTADRVNIESDSESRECVRNLVRLPKEYRRKNKFIQVIDSLRHHYGGHNTHLPTFNIRKNQMEKRDLLMILTDSKNEPLVPDEIYKLQNKLLSMFIEYLEKLNQSMRESGL